MRLTGLTLTRYGNFDAEHLTFDPRPGVLNLLLAPNGAGKSVLRGAFCDLLFGIGGQSPMGFRFGYSGMRISAEAIAPDSRPFTFGRRKGRGNTLVDAADGALDPATITPFLGRIDRVRLERLFALDTARLRQGEADLLASDGELGAALVSGTGGARDLRGLRKSLEDSRDALAPLRRSSQRPFYKAVDQFVDARKRRDASLLKPDQWQKMQADLCSAEQHKDEQNRIVDLESAEIARLERIRRVLPWLAAHDAAAAWLDAHPHAPVLDPALMPRLNEARSQIVIAEQRLRREREAAAALTEQLGGLVVDDRLVAEAAEVDRLVEAAGAARKAIADRPAVQADADASSAIVAARLAELASPLTVERAAEAIPPRAVVNQARRLIQTFAARQEAVQSAPALVAERERERDAMRAEQAAHPGPGDTSDLEALVREIRADGDPGRRLRDAAQRQTEAATNLNGLLVRVPGWTGGDAALLALAPLPPETYERHAAELAETRTEATTRLQALRTSRQAHDEARDRLTAFTASAPLPDAAGLSHARARRDEGWQLIYRRAFTADPPTPPEERNFAGTLPLPLAYERAVTAADDIADRRVQQAAVVAAAQAAQSAADAAEAALQESDTRHRIAAETQRAAERAWTQICGVLPLGDSPSIRDVHAFLAAREKVIDARQALDLAEAARSALTASHAGWAARLSATLPPTDNTTLVDLLALAEKRLQETQQAEQRRATLQAKCDAAEKALAEARSRQRQASDASAAWQTAWTQAMRDLGRPSDEDPRVTEDVLQVMAELDKARNQHAGLAERVAGMRRDIARFAEAAIALAERAAPDLERADPFQLIGTIRLRLQQARELVRQRDLLKQQAADAAAQAALAERQLADRQAALAAVLALAGANTVEDAECRLVLAAERARHAENRFAAEAKLAEAGDLRPLTELRREVAVVPAEEIPGRIEAASQRRKAAQDDAQAAAAAASALAQQMQQTAAATATTDAAADQQAAVASIARVLEEALVHHLAAEMLGRALAAVERDSEPAMLRRIGALFSALTGGVYTKVLTEAGPEAGEYNVTRLSLRQRDFPHERQAVNELSEGTRDQLFLALRLAAIEHHAAAAAPLPFIGDDILQTFDDDRALAAMRVLLQISDKVQVILLTHHRHVLDLAARLPAGSVHVCRIGMAAETV